MASVVDSIFQNSLRLAGEPLPVELAEARQPDPVLGVGELKDGAEDPQQIRLFDSETALVITEGEAEVEAAAVTSTRFDGRVTAAASIGSNQWEYTVIKQKTDANGDLVDDLDASGVPVLQVTAKNKMEIDNDGVGRESAGVQVDDDGTFNVTLMPVGANEVACRTTVYIEYGPDQEGPFYWIDVPNEVDVSCVP